MACTGVRVVPIGAGLCNVKAVRESPSRRNATDQQQKCNELLPFCYAQNAVDPRIQVLMQAVKMEAGHRCDTKQTTNIRSIRRKTESTLQSMS
jgi:hypothetical protein